MLDDPGIEFRWEARFSASFETVPDFHLYSGYRVFSLKVKRPGRGLDHPTLSSAGVKGLAEVYLYTTPHEGVSGLF